MWWTHLHKECDYKSIVELGRAEHTFNPSNASNDWELEISWATYNTPSQQANKTQLQLYFKPKWATMPLLLVFEDFKDFACVLQSFSEPHVESVPSKLQLREKGQRDNGIQSYTMREKPRLTKKSTCMLMLGLARRSLFWSQPWTLRIYGSYSEVSLMFPWVSSQ